MTIPTKVPTLVAGTIACALAIGWGMQTFVPAPGQTAAAPTPGAKAPAAPLVMAGASMIAAPLLQDPSLRDEPVAEFTAAVSLSESTPEMTPEIAIPMPVHGPDLAVTEPTDDAGDDMVARNDTDLMDTGDIAAAPADPLPACDITASADPAPRASVRLSIDAPCLPSSHVTIHHTGLMFSATTDADGHLDVTVPALKDRAVFIVSLGPGFGTVVTADVPDVAHWSRVALQWQGEAGFQIHAREFGADYNTPGHVWSGTPGNPLTGSYLLRLGDGAGALPRMAEVYSFPRGSGLSGLVTLTVETEVTADTCGKRLSAEALEHRDADSLTSRELDLAMPNCAAIGDFLVLNNLVDDLKIAAN